MNRDSDGTSLGKVMNGNDDARIAFARMRMERGLATDMDSALLQVDQSLIESRERWRRIDEKTAGWDKPLEVFENFREYLLLLEQPEESIAAIWDVFVARGQIKPISLEVQS